MNNFLNMLLSRFHKAHSIQHAVFKLLRAWQKKLDNLGIIGTILMGLSKAYDCLPYDLLIAKREAYGIDRYNLRLSMNYLNSHKQQTKVGSSDSKWSQIKHGIPQGSMLGLLLFNIIINDLFFVIEESDICKFVDDNIL